MSEILQTLRTDANLNPDSVTEPATHIAINAVQTEARENLAQLRTALNTQLALMRTQVGTTTDIARLAAYNNAIARLESLKLNITNREAATAPGDLATAGDVIASGERLTRGWASTATTHVNKVPVLGTAFFVAGVAGMFGWAKGLWDWARGNNAESTAKKKKEKKAPEATS